MYITQPKILRCMSHHSVFSVLCHTAQNFLMHVTPPSFLYSYMAGVKRPIGGRGTTHRWQWDRPQAAVALPTGGSGTAHRQQWGCPWMVVRPPTGGHYLQHRFGWLLSLDLLHELLPFFFTPNQVLVEHNMANATSYIFVHCSSVLLFVNTTICDAEYFVIYA